MALDLAVAEQVEQPLNFFVRDRPAQADAVDVVDGHEHGSFIGHAQLIEAARCAHYGLRLNALDDAEPMIWVDDLVADLKCHVPPGY